MGLAKSTVRQLDVLYFGLDMRGQVLCSQAKEYEEAGDYEAARATLEEFWPRGIERPHTDGLAPEAAAELLLRAGVLTSLIGSSRQEVGSQETAKNLISEGLRAFEGLSAIEKAREARVELAVCYWREGASDEARVILRGVLDEVGDEESELKAVALLRGAIIERTATRYNDALRYLTAAAPIFERGSNHTQLGKFHGQLAVVLKNLGESERREDYTDRALLEYTAASYHFEQAGHVRYGARVENNLGFLYAICRKFPEAHEHLDRARRLFVSLHDSGGVAYVDETRARAFLTEGRFAEAERSARSSVKTHEKGDEQSMLAGALTAHGTALARLGEGASAHGSLRRAIGVAEQIGDLEGAGVAALTIIEELPELFTGDELRAFYLKADELLARTQSLEALKRLRACARIVLNSRQRESKRRSVPEFIHTDPNTGELLRQAEIIAGSQSAVLLSGETGTGKEVLARLIHRWSGRGGRMITLNCASLNEAIFESQVFGHVKGSFTDAREEYEGAARVAAGGTLFLDEISELHPNNQAKLLRLIEFGEARKLGASYAENLDVRIISATNSNLQELVARGRFRADLFYRLQTFHIPIPPLRQRSDDIVALAQHFINAARERYGRRVAFAPETIEALRQLPLKGNARELQSLIERLMLATEDGGVVLPEKIKADALGMQAKLDPAKPWEQFSLKDAIHNFERRFIEAALKDADGKVSHAARLLGFNHHESLNSLLKHRHSDLLQARKPVTPRRRSIITRHE